MNSFDTIMEAISDEKYVAMKNTYFEGTEGKVQKIMSDMQVRLKNAKKLEKSGNMKEAKKEYLAIIANLKKCNVILDMIRAKLHNRNKNPIATWSLIAIGTILSLFAIGFVGLFSALDTMYGSGRISSRIIMMASLVTLDVAPLGFGVGAGIMTINKSDKTYAEFQERFMKEFKKDPTGTINELKMSINDMIDSIEEHIREMGK